MWVWFWQSLPGGDTTFTGTDKWVVLGMAAAIITPTWLAWWNARVAKMATKPDHGNSLADKLTRIETQSDRIETKVDVHTMTLDAHREDVTAIKNGLADHRAEVNKIVRELRHDIDDIHGEIHALQEAQSHRREIIQEEEGNIQ